MNDQHIGHTNQNDLTKPANTDEGKCATCKKNPCICSNKESLGSQDAKKERRPRTKPPKIRWI